MVAAYMRRSYPQVIWWMQSISGARSQKVKKDFNKSCIAFFVAVTLYSVINYISFEISSLKDKIFFKISCIAFREMEMFNLNV